MANNSEEYNGWSNRETWAAALHIDNDQWSHDHARELLAQDRNKYRFADTLRVWVEDMLTDVYHDPNEASQWARMAACDIGSIWRVDWVEVATSIMEE